jgi:hypothetical protein
VSDRIKNLKCLHCGGVVEVNFITSDFDSLRVGFCCLDQGCEGWDEPMFCDFEGRITINVAEHWWDDEYDPPPPRPPSLRVVRP